MKLLVSEYEVVVQSTSKEGDNREFYVKLLGPINSPYEGVSSSLTFQSLLGDLDSASHAS